MYTWFDAQLDQKILDGIYLACQRSLWMALKYKPSNSDPSFFQETLLKQVRITHGLFCILNLISLIVFIALVETHIFSDTHKVWLIMEATNRLIIYLIPIALLIMNTALSGAYTHHVKTLRFRFCEKKSLNSLRFSLRRETDAKSKAKSWAIINDL